MKDVLKGKGKRKRTVRKVILFCRVLDKAVNYLVARPASPLTNAREINKSSKDLLII